MKTLLKVKLIKALRNEGFEFENLEDLNKVVEYIMEMYLDEAVIVEEGSKQAADEAISDYIDQDLFNSTEIKRLLVL